MHMEAEQLNALFKCGDAHGNGTGPCKRHGWTFSQGVRNWCGKRGHTANACEHRARYCKTRGRGRHVPPDATVAPAIGNQPGEPNRHEATSVAPCAVNAKTSVKNIRVALHDVDVPCVLQGGASNSSSNNGRRIQVSLSEPIVVKSGQGNTSNPPSCIVGIGEGSGMKFANGQHQGREIRLAHRQR